MTLEQFKQKQEEFLIYLSVEKNCSLHTQRAYQGDLNQFARFWEHLSPDEQQELSLRQIIERYLVSLFHKKITKTLNHEDQLNQPVCRPDQYCFAC